LDRARIINLRLHWGQEHTEAKNILSRPWQPVVIPSSIQIAGRHRRKAPLPDSAHGSVMAGSDRGLPVAIDGADQIPGAAVHVEHAEILASGM
jgi:hypothetical protein